MRIRVAGSNGRRVAVRYATRIGQVLDSRPAQDLTSSRSSELEAGYVPALERTIR
jgi:hypothetical protein